MDWGTISAIAALASINIAILMGLISWLRSDMKAFESEIRGWNREILAENRDFHTKLAVQDLEFKLRLSAIEERNKKN